MPDTIPPGGAFRKRLEFGGEVWEVKHSATEVIGPGPNRFGEANAWVDEAGRLHLRVTPTPQGWVCAEVRSLRSLGYGRAEVTVETPFESLPDQAVFGFFTWSDDVVQHNREIDFEVSRWGKRKAPNVHLTLQPGPSASFQAPPPTWRTRVSLDWAPGRATVEAVAEDGFAFARKAFHLGVPTVGGDVRHRFNLWLFRGQTPKPSRPIEIVLSAFRFVPLGGSDTIRP